MSEIENQLLVGSDALFADVLSYITDQSKQFRQCALRHGEYNRSAEDVAFRAAEVLDRIAFEIRSANSANQSREHHPEAD